MNINTTSLERQLTQIIQNHTVTSTSQKSPKVEITKHSAEYTRLMEARDAGKEAEYLTAQAENMNQFVKELDLNINFNIEVSKTGEYLVQVLDENNNVIKTIPVEAFVEAREKIKIQVKGLLEDSQN